VFGIILCLHCSVCFHGCLPLAFCFAFHSLTVTTIHCFTLLSLLNIPSSEAFENCSWIMCLYVCHVKAAMMCCKELLKRMEPAKKEGLKDQTWQEWTQEAYKQSIDLCATYMWVAIAWLDVCMWNFSQAGRELWHWCECAVNCATLLKGHALNCGTDVSVQLIVPHCLKVRHWTVALMWVCS
jgi:hypothetical protein